MNVNISGRADFLFQHPVDAGRRRAMLFVTQSRHAVTLGGLNGSFD